MKWSWKKFGLHFGAACVLALVIAYFFSLIIDAGRGPGSADSTQLSMAVGAFVAAMILAALSGWKEWDPKPPIVAGVIDSIFYSGNLGRGLMAFIFAVPLYFVARKVRLIFLYPFQTKARENNEPDSRP